jgi:hypothetical protein
MAAELRSVCCGSTVEARGANLLICMCCDHDCRVYSIRVNEEG